MLGGGEKDSTKYNCQVATLSFRHATFESSAVNSSP